MNGLGYLDLLKLLAPEVGLALTMVAVLVVDLGIMRGEPLRHRFWMGGGVTALGCGVALIWLVVVPADVRWLDGLLVIDPLSQWVKVVLVGLGLLTVVLSLEAEFTRHVGEYYALLLLALLGMMFMVSSEEVLTIFVSLELTSVSLYLLVAFQKRSAASMEAGLKYFLFGGMAAAFLLFGLSLLYGLSGSTLLRSMAPALAGRATDPAVIPALVMVIMGLGFKIAAVPFHLWAPDVYEGAPTPAAALVASGSKVASFFLLAKVLAFGFEGVAGSGGWRDYAAGWLPVLVVLALASMLVGNLAALAQRNYKRLLAYSAVAHSGYVLLALMAMGPAAGRRGAMAALLYYVVTYGLTVLGAFGVFGVLERKGSRGELADFAGLSRRSPWLAMCLMVFLLSLAGIPPLAGFFGKFYVFAIAAGTEPNRLGLLWLVAVAIGLSVVSLYYYLMVLKRAYVLPEPEPGGPLALTAAERFGLGIAAVGVVALGVFPTWVLAGLTEALGRAGY